MYKGIACCGFLGNLFEVKVKDAVKQTPPTCGIQPAGPVEYGSIFLLDLQHRGEEKPLWTFPISFELCYTKVHFRVVQISDCEDIRLQHPLIFGQERRSNSRFCSIQISRKMKSLLHCMEPILHYFPNSQPIKPAICPI
ncbi:hypothetical protein D3C73_1330810 [compost metagenome]